MTTYDHTQNDENPKEDVRKVTVFVVGFFLLMILLKYFIRG